METADFMPDETVIAGIRKNIEAYEAGRASAYRQVRWRVPVFLGLLLVFVALVAWRWKWSVGSPSLRPIINFPPGILIISALSKIRGVSTGVAVGVGLFVFGGGSP